MKLEELFDWMVTFCDDLDPTNLYERPTIRYYWTCAYNADDNVVGVNLEEIERLSLCIIETIAHECRHWYQYKSGWLHNQSDVFDVLLGIQRCSWKDQLVVASPTTQEEYEQLPWEKDANEYAADARTRLLNKEKVAA